VRLAVIESATAPRSSWLPLLEAVAHAKESLLVVADTIDRHLLKTLAINSARETLACCAVRASSSVSDSGIQDDGPNVPPPASPKKLPLADGVWVRRSASIVFPAEGAGSIGELTEVSVIAVGGHNLEYQQQRLRYVVRALEYLEYGQNV
jgi:hypothetical protein